MLSDQCSGGSFSVLQSLGHGAPDRFGIQFDLEREVRKRCDSRNRCDQLTDVSNVIKCQVRRLTIVRVRKWKIILSTLALYRNGSFGSQAVAQRVAREWLLSGVKQPLKISLDRKVVLSVCCHLKQPLSDIVMRGWFRPIAVTWIINFVLKLWPEYALISPEDRTSCLPNRRLIPIV